jgi:hypothetical protein
MSAPTRQQAQSSLAIPHFLSRAAAKGTSHHDLSLPPPATSCGTTHTLAAYRRAAQCCAASSRRRLHTGDRVAGWENHTLLCSSASGCSTRTSHPVASLTHFPLPSPPATSTALTATSTLPRRHHNHKKTTPVTKNGRGEGKHHTLALNLASLTVTRAM